jgi:hypothetical protein
MASAKTQRYTDISLNTFKKTNMHYTQNNLLKYQDPTYLGFKLFFLFDQPDSGLLSEVDQPNTAMGYLLKRGENERAAYLKKFVQLLKRINSECPWFFQQIDGLADAWKHGFDEVDFKPIIPADRKITISTLDESIDLRITALMDLYRKACFDWSNRREVVPRNLRYFNVSVFVYESRTINRSGTPYPVDDEFNAVNIGTNTIQQTQTQKDNAKSTRQEMDIVLGTDPGKDDSYKVHDYINDQITRILFNFSYCEWNPDESGVIADAVSNKEMALKAQKLVFSYRQVYEENLYRFFHDKMVTDIMLPTLDRLAKDDPKLGPDANYGIWDPNNPNPGTLDNNSSTRGNDPAPRSGMGGTSLGNLGDNPLSASASLSLAKLITSFLPDNPLKDAASKALDSLKAGFSFNGGKSFGNVYGLDSLNLPPIVQGALSQLSNATLGALQSKINSLFLGNVYGFSGAGVVAAVGGGLNGIIGAAKGAAAGESTSLSNASKSIKGNVGFENSASNANGKDIDPSGNISINSTSLNNSTIDWASPGIPGEPRLPSSNIDPTGNIFEGSVSLNNGTDVDPTGNSFSGSVSLNNGADQNPSGNYGSDSSSISNGADQDPSGNYGDGSSSITNGEDQDPSGNYGDGSPSLGNANPPAGSIDNVFE